MHMIFGNIFKKNDNKKEINKNDLVEHNNDEIIKDGPLNEDEELIFASDKTPDAKDIKLGTILKKESKEKKINKQIRNSSLRTRSNRESHITRSHHKKYRSSVKDIVSAYDLIRKPIITEKASTASERGVYIFEVKSNATKHAVSDAIEAKYNVKPNKVCIAKIASKPKRVRIPGKERSMGYTSKSKKAYVYLKKGDKIKLI